MSWRRSTPGSIGIAGARRGNISSSWCFPTRWAKPHTAQTWARTSLVSIGRGPRAPTACTSTTCIPQTMAPTTAPSPSPPSSSWALAHGSLWVSSTPGLPKCATSRLWWGPLGKGWWVLVGSSQFWDARLGFWVFFCRDLWGWTKEKIAKF